jgi:hypothetical protein
MKRSPEMQRLDEMLKPSKISAHGFLGQDVRPVEEIVEADRKSVLDAGYTLAQLAGRMREITQAVKNAQETTIPVAENREARAIEVRGKIPCPWPHEVSFPKSVTEMRNTSTGETLRWSDLNIHMIEAHGFFEGLGSPFRNDPRQLIAMLYPGEAGAEQGEA